MGYEVLDSGRTSDGGGAGLGPIDVVSLDDLPDPHEHAGRPPGPPRLPHWVRQAAARISPVLAIVLVGALVAGGAAGAWVAHRRAAATQESAARAAVSAFALAVGFDGGTTGESGQVQLPVSVRVFNVGSRPLTIAAAKGAGALVDTSSRVTVATGDGVVQPGQDALVRVRVHLRCDSPEAVRLSVPVRSEDGTLHELTVRDSDQGMLSQTPQAICAQSSQVEPMSVQLIGTLAQPALELANSTEHPVTVSLDSGSPLTQAASQYLSVTTKPGLPVTVAAGATRRLTLRLDVQGCHRDLGRLTDGGMGYFGLNVESPNELSQVGVDVSALVGAALERSCR
ncbi:hypothetical protein [Angustibacter sp. Root456]|uniref:hypothetical protein n=1 Tax=Angustibacter sp. Root456 TaxID=1736539 RepID=UPI0007018E54|nr:hypothetical protein [Angustibacter sp. Root456]KQX61640.1 hypothetical protein ASD06_13620 [Angustibacter sp. Root456]